MARQVIYLTHMADPDPAIYQGLREAGCVVLQTKDFEETLRALRLTGNGYTPLFAAEIQSGALAFLALLRSRGEPLPPTILFDREGFDIHAPIKALEFGVRVYLLADQPELERKMMTRLFIENYDLEQTGLHRRGRALSADEARYDGSANPSPHVLRGHDAAPLSFDWEADGHVITVNGAYIRLSPIEGRIFDRLVHNHGHTVPSTELVTHALGEEGLDAEKSAQRLRPHVMRLRRKLARCPALQVQVVNARGVGYMLI